MMNTVDNVLSPVKTGATQSMTPFSRVLYRPEALPRPITLTKRRRAWCFFGRCGRTAELHRWPDLEIVPSRLRTGGLGQR